MGDIDNDMGATRIYQRPSARRVPARQEARRTRRRRITGWVLVGVALVVVFLLFTVGSAVWTVVRGIRTEISGAVPVPRPGEHINVLFLGLDSVVDSSGNVNLETPLRQSRSRTDTMILISVDPVTNQAALISIPRDTRCEIPGRDGWDKINAAHVYGGPVLAMQTVERLLGIPVHYYVRTNYQGVQAVVDVLNGVEVDVEMDMHYEDPYQDLVIDLHKGLQVLDGDKALQYLRYRNLGGDIARITRQQKFIAALVDRTLSFGTVFRAQSLAREVIKYIDTNLEPGDMLDFGLLASRISDPAIEMITLPGVAEYVTDEGRPPLSYWLVDRAETDAAVDRLVWGVDREANARFTVRVLNGSGIAGQAAAAAARLRLDGFNVVEVGNAKLQNYDRTAVITHVEAQEASDRMMSSVMRHAADAESLRDVTANPVAQITVVVGKDWQN